MSIVLECKNICKEYGDKIILNNINLKFNSNERVGIVGSNGCGKTTLANIISNEIEVTKGSVEYYLSCTKIGYMKQSIENKDLKSTLSGGEKTKKKLIKILFGNYNVLLLDEPSNHLDYESVHWLIDEINKFKGLIIIISHDRYFLDNTVNKIIEIQNGNAKEYSGNYTDYRNKKRNEYENSLHLYYEQEKTKERINEQINQLKSWSSKAHKDSRKKAIETGNKFGGKEHNRAKAKKMDNAIKSRIKKLEKITVEGIEKPKEEKNVYFQLSNAKKIGSIVLSAENISKSFDNKVLFDKSSFYIKHGEKVGVYGCNGCGKSTLIKCIFNKCTYNGSLYISENRKIGYISQDVEGIDEEKTIIELFHWNNRKEQGELRTKLNLIGFHSDSLYKKVKYLSLGERMKLKLLLMIQNQCDVLILDEPTNHIDLHVREQLENILDNYNGTIILVTHDRYMLEKICNKLLVFENRHIKRYEYNFKEYMNNKEKCHNTFKEQTDKTLEEKMIIENKLSEIISRLSFCQSGSEEYRILDREYKLLLEKRN